MVVSVRSATSPETAVFIFQLLQSFCLTDFHAAVLAFPAVKGLLADVVLADEICCLLAGLMFFKNLDYLLFAKSFFHVNHSIFSF